jgi:hypothetical protein
MLTILLSLAGVAAVEVAIRAVAALAVILPGHWLYQPERHTQLQLAAVAAAATEIHRALVVAVATLHSVASTVMVAVVVDITMA